MGVPIHARASPCCTRAVRQVGQAFLPAEMVRRRLATGGGGPTLERRLLGAGAAVGAACAASACAVLHLCRFTPDVAVTATVRSLVPEVCLCIATHGPMCACEGALLASRQLRFLGGFYTANAVLMVSAFAGIEALGLGLRAAWRAMLGFQVLRLVTFAARLDRAPTPAK